MKKLTLQFFALLLTLFIMTGCGKKEDASNTSSGKEETVEKTSSSEPTGELSLSSREFKPGQSITVNYSAEGEFGSNSWIGIIPSEIEHGDESRNDQHDVSYQYFKDKKGNLKFTAPEKPGKYDFRMHTSDASGKEVAYVTFTVAELVEETDTDYKLSSNKTSYKAGEDITVTFTASPNWGSNAWIGIIPSEIEHGDESKNDQHDVSYKYLSGKTSGSITLKAPDKPGKYDLRMHDSDSNGKEIKYVSFTVK